MWRRRWVATERRFDGQHCCGCALASPIAQSPSRSPPILFQAEVAALRTQLQDTQVGRSSDGQLWLLRCWACWLVPVKSCSPLLERCMLIACQRQVLAAGSNIEGVRAAQQLRICAALLPARLTTSPPRLPSPSPPLQAEAAALRTQLQDGRVGLCLRAFVA